MVTCCADRSRPEDRRVLFTPALLKDPSHCIASVILIQEHLTNELMQEGASRSLTDHASHAPGSSRFCVDTESTAVQSRSNSSVAAVVLRAKSVGEGVIVVRLHRRIATQLEVAEVLGSVQDLKADLVVGDHVLRLLEGRVH